MVIRLLCSFNHDSKSYNSHVDKLHIQIDDLQDAGDSSKPVDNKAEEDIEQLKKEKG